MQLFKSKKTAVWACAALALGASAASYAGECQTFAAQTGAIANDSIDIYIADHNGLAKVVDLSDRVVRSYFNVQPWVIGNNDFSVDQVDFVTWFMQVRFSDLDTVVNRPLVNVSDYYQVTVTIWEKNVATGDRIAVVEFDSNAHAVENKPQIKKQAFYHVFDFTQNVYYAEATVRNQGKMQAGAVLETFQLCFDYYLGGG